MAEEAPWQRGAGCMSLDGPGLCSVVDCLGGVLCAHTWSFTVRKGLPYLVWMQGSFSLEVGSQFQRRYSSECKSHVQWAWPWCPCRCSDKSAYLVCWAGSKQEWLGGRVPWGSCLVPDWSFFTCGKPSRSMQGTWWGQAPPSQEVWGPLISWKSPPVRCSRLPWPSPSKENFQSLSWQMWKREKRSL